MAVTRTLPSAGGLAVARDLTEDCRDTALDGLERLSREPIVGLAQPAGEPGQELDRDVRLLADQTAHVGAEDRDGLGLLQRLDGRRPPLVVEHRELPEDVARPEVREGDRAAVEVDPDRTRATRRTM